VIAINITAPKMKVTTIEREKIDDLNSAGGSTASAVRDSCHIAPAIRAAPADDARPHRGVAPAIEGRLGMWPSTNKRSATGDSGRAQVVDPRADVRAGRRLGKVNSRAIQITRPMGRFT